MELATAGRVMAQGEVPNNMFMPSGMGETLDVGRDLGVGVTRYKAPRGELEGDIAHVAVTLD